MLSEIKRRSPPAVGKPGIKLKRSNVARCRDCLSVLGSVGGIWDRPPWCYDLCTVPETGRDTSCLCVLDDSRLPGPSSACVRFEKNLATVAYVLLSLIYA